MVGGAAVAVDVGGGGAQVGDGAGKALDLVADVLDLPDDRVLRAALDDAALMLGDRAKAATAKAAAHDVDRKTDHLPGRYLARAVVAPVLVCIDRVRAAGIGQVEHMVELGRAQRNR